MEQTPIESTLRAAVSAEKRRSGNNNIEVAYRLHDLGKYLASQQRFLDAEPVMEQAACIVALHTVQAGLSSASRDTAPILEGYEIVLKILGVDREERKARLQSALESARAKILMPGTPD